LPPESRREIVSPGNLEIARNAALKPIEDIANEMGLAV